MSSPTPALDRRLPSTRNNHVNSSVTALQGATAAAIHAATSRPGSPASSHRHGVATGINRHRSGSAAHAATDSETAPEIGSVKDKIGRFASRPQSPGLREHNLPSRPRTPQQIAARFAVERSPVRGERAAMNTVMTEMRSQNQSSQSGNNRQSLEVMSPEPIDDDDMAKEAAERSVQGSAESSPSRDKTIPRKPAAPQLTAAQAAASKAPPIPPLPRKSRTIADEPVSVSRAPSSARSNDTQSFEDVPLGIQSSSRSRTMPATLDDKPPALPPRPGAIDTRIHRRLLAERDSPRRSPSPSSGSLYRPSYNTSSSSLLDDNQSMSEEALSDAIVASSLAARNLPTRKVPPTPPPPRRPRSRSILSGKRDSSHPPSPSGILRQTLRTPNKADKEEHDHHHHHHHHHHLIHRHPHKHHEGDRMRWRSEITEKERKRYEGVWAANKGLLIPTSHGKPAHPYPPDASEMVLSIVVRDIWSRSRLPRQTLEQVWNLVDRQDIGLLNREEFVVGMWLIDQQLKGRKLPPAVPDSVWSSVTRVSGISLWNVPVPS